jgi:hypothetical protein
MDNIKLYEEILFYGLSDYVANKEHIRENYKEIIFDQ